MDESDSTQKSISAVISEVFGIKVEFYNGLAGLLAGWKMRDVTEVSEGDFRAVRARVCD